MNLLSQILHSSKARWEAVVVGNNDWWIQTLKIQHNYWITVKSKQNKITHDSGCLDDKEEEDNDVDDDKIYIYIWYDIQFSSIEREKNSTCNRCNNSLDPNLPKTAAERITKYENLALQISNSWKLNNVSIYPLGYLLCASNASTRVSRPLTCVPATSVHTSFTPTYLSRNMYVDQTVLCERV